MIAQRASTTRTIATPTRATEARRARVVANAADRKMWCVRTRARIGEWERRITSRANARASRARDASRDASMRARWRRTYPRYGISDMAAARDRASARGRANRARGAERGARRDANDDTDGMIRCLRAMQVARAVQGAGAPRRHHRRGLRLRSSRLGQRPDAP